MDSCSTSVRDRTDRCPGVLARHEAADGSLARVRLPGGRIDAAGLCAIADVAASGNGLIELTSRASLQIRGLSAGVDGAAAARLRAGGLLPSIAHDRVRNVLASPVAGRHPRSLAVTDDVVAGLDRGLCADPALAEMPGTFLFTVEDGSGTTAAAGRADVALVAEGRARFALWLAGARTTLSASPTSAPALALDAARGFLDLLSGSRDAWRVAEVDGGPARLARRLGGELAAGAPLAPCTLEPGTLAQRDGRVAVTVLPPLGRVDPPTVRRLATLAHEVRLSAARTLTIVDVARCDAAALACELRALGLVTDAGSGWQGLSACAGLGACTRATVDVRAAAAARAEVREPGAVAEHWVACERGCGYSPGAVLRVLGG